MDIIFGAVTFVFVALVIITAITIGMSLLVWFMLVGAMLSLYVAVRRRWMRWQFIREAESTTQIIEGDFKDLTDHHTP
ncbi:MAG: hypothetical protein EBV03_07305 [Proteobacteria bacterium]|nr:hypothetical protein [Pseudomonadota bacterium]